VAFFIIRSTTSFFALMSLLAVGTLAFDDIETPHGRAEMVVGGACTYIALAASYFVQPVQLVSVVGDDFPESTLDDLRSRGVDLQGLQIMEGKKSFYWAGKYHRDLNSRDTLDTQLNVLADFNPIVPPAFRKPDFLMLGNLTPQIQMQVIDQLEERPKLIALDTMNFWMNSAWDDLMKVIKRIDMLIINDEEARQLSGEHALLKAANIIHEMGPKYVVIKKGEHGALLFHEGKTFFAAGLPLAEVIDPTGAGDTFAGGFMGALAARGDLSFAGMKRAIIYGSAMASFCVEKFSTERLADLDENLIRERVEQFAELVNFQV
jgi:sugar/nucleoside kinase (ribokinase family)